MSYDYHNYKHKNPFIEWYVVYDKWQLIIWFFFSAQNNEETASQNWFCYEYDFDDTNVKWRKSLSNVFF